MIEQRNELKIKVSKKQLEYFLISNNLKEIYEERNIKSIYFDTNNLKLFNTSINFDVDTYKVRFRSYNQEDSVIYLEKKYKTLNGKFKTKKKISGYKSIDEIKTLNYNSDSLYPKLLVTYSRKYFHGPNSRITIDSNIKYYKTNSNAFCNRNFYVIEYKLKNSQNTKDYFFNDIKLPLSTFSKYLDGISKLYFNNDDYAA